MRGEGFARNDSAPDSASAAGSDTRDAVQREAGERASGGDDLGSEYSDVLSDCTRGSDVPDIRLPVDDSQPGSLFAV